jgi:hypothetical protein
MHALSGSPCPFNSSHSKWTLLQRLPPFVLGCAQDPIHDSDNTTQNSAAMMMAEEQMQTEGIDLKDTAAL